MGAEPGPAGLPPGYPREYEQEVPTSVACRRGMVPGGVPRGFPDVDRAALIAYRAPGGWLTCSRTATTPSICRTLPAIL